MTRARLAALLLVAALMLPACRRERRGRGGAKAAQVPRARVTLRYRLAGPPPRDPELAPRQAVRTIKARLLAAGIKGVEVSLEGRAIVVALPLLSEAEVANVRALLAPVGQMEACVVAEDSIAGMALYEAARARGAPHGVSAEETSSGGHFEYYLEAPSHTALARWLSIEKPEPDPNLGPLHLVYQDVTPVDDGGVARTAVRAYAVTDVDKIEGGTLFDAEAVEDPATQHIDVRVYFDREGARALEQLTSRNVGRRMAISLDGRALVVAKITGSIGGGQALITLGQGLSPVEEATEAARLVNLLKAGSLPGPLLELLADGSAPR